MTDFLDISRIAAFCILLIALNLMLIAWWLRSISHSLSQLALNSTLPVEIATPSDPQLSFAIENIAWAAGRSFEQGRRTDR